MEKAEFSQKFLCQRAMIKKTSVPAPLAGFCGAVGYIIFADVPQML